MANHNPNFLNNSFYHIANFGIDNKIIFNDKKDIDRFLALLKYYQIKNPPTRFAFRNRPTAKNSDAKPVQMVEILVYALMPDHFHLLLKQTETDGVRIFLTKIINSYTKYFNARQKRSGTLFKGPFKARGIEVNKLSDVSRHIHLDPLLRGLVRSISNFPFSSFPEYLGENQGLCQKNYILENFENVSEYRDFIVDQEEYKSILPQISPLLLEKN